MHISGRSSGALALLHSDPRRSRGNIKGEIIRTKSFTNDLTRSTAQIMIEARYEEVDLCIIWLGWLEDYYVIVSRRPIRYLQASKRGRGIITPIMDPDTF